MIAPIRHKFNCFFKYFEKKQKKIRGCPFLRGVSVFFFFSIMEMAIIFSDFFYLVFPFSHHMPKFKYPANVTQRKYGTMSRAAVFEIG